MLHLTFVKLQDVRDSITAEVAFINIARGLLAAKSFSKFSGLEATAVKYCIASIVLVAA